MEYISLSSEEKETCQVQLLSSQIDILTITKRYKKFKELRKQELSLKNEVRRKITALQEDLKNFEKNAPHFHQPKIVVEKSRAPQEVKKRDELETEIDSLRQRIAQLNKEI